MRLRRSVVHVYGMNFIFTNVLVKCIYKYCLQVVDCVVDSSAEETSQQVWLGHQVNIFLNLFVWIDLLWFCLHYLHYINPLSVCLSVPRPSNSQKMWVTTFKIPWVNFYYN